VKRLSPKLHVAWLTRPSDVESVLGPIAQVVEIHWSGSAERELSTTPIRATWDPNFPKVIGGRAGRGAMLWISPVAQADAATVRPVILDVVLPETRSWLEHAMSAGDVWQSVWQSRGWSVVDGKILRRDWNGWA
jgi:hypothetical protein